MSEQEDPVFAYWKERRGQLRQPESQRAIMTTYLLVITAAVKVYEVVLLCITGAVR